MVKQLIIVILVILTATVAISGCTTKTAANGTFGEQNISLNLIYLSNNATAGNYTYNGTEYYYVEGYIVNNNSYDAFNVKVNSIAYDAHGNLVATNDSAYLEPVSIPAKGNSYFYVEFNDSNNSIVRYDIQILNASGTVS
jgi:hypothetical protein